MASSLPWISVEANNVNDLQKLQENLRMENILLC